MAKHKKDKGRYHKEKFIAVAHCALQYGINLYNEKRRETPLNISKNQILTIIYFHPVFDKFLHFDGKYMT